MPPNAFTITSSESSMMAVGRLVLSMFDNVITMLQRLTDDALGFLTLAWLISVMSALPFLLDLRLADRIRRATDGFAAFVSRNRHTSS